MSLLESLRSGSDSTFMQIILALVVVSFIGWGVRNDGDTQEVVATVNGEAISSVDFNQGFRNAEQMEESRSQQPITEERRTELRERVMQDLIRRTALTQEAHRLGLEISDAEVANALLEMTFLHDKEGKFDLTAYQNYLRRRGTTRSNFEEEIRDSLLLQKLQSLMQLGASVSEPLVKQNYVDQNTKVNIEFVRIRPQSFGPTINPTPEEIKTWIADNPTLLSERYQKDFERLYNKPEVMTLSLIRIPQRDDGLALADLKPKVDAIKAEVDGGADFAELARRWSEDPSAARGGSLGEVKVSSLDVDAAKALAELQAGAISGVLVGIKDLRLYKVEGRSPARVVPLEEVQDTIATDLIRETQAPAKAIAFAEQTVLAKWRETGALPQAEMDPLNLHASTTGPIPVGGEGGGLYKPPADLLKAARQAEPGSVLPQVYEADGVYWVGKVMEREEADLSAYEEQKDKYREQSLFRGRDEFLQSWVDDVVARAVIGR